MLLIVSVVVILSAPTIAWTTCEQQTFCKTIRYNFNTNASYSLANIVVADKITGNIINDQNSKSFDFCFIALAGDIFRVSVEDPDNARFSPKDHVLYRDVSIEKFTVVSQNDTVIMLSFHSNLFVNLYVSPFRIEVVREDQTIIEVNKANRLVINTEKDDNSLALDISFPIAKTVYGIPQHAERLSLPTTGPNGLSAFRLFNVDHYGYQPLTREALYSAIPVLYGISTNITSGIFWMNAAQTFVDITNEGNGVDSLFISETGALELFLFGGPTLKDCVRQYTALTGVGPLPQYFALGYHQSRFSYTSQEDVETVVAEFDNHNFPMDVIWLDIDYTYGYRYFTWNYTAFPNPIEMQNKIAATGRKVVAISDPHIKVEKGYFVYDQAFANNYFVKNPNSSVFEGKCWPGLSSYPDFLNSAVQKWYGDLYNLENFNDTTLNLYIWNDMNEPVIFDVPEKAMPGDVLHYGGWKHRDIHNIYGLKHTQATFEGLLRRDPTKRPFILTRAHFAGSQRYSAVWTGDNSPTWEHLQISIPMILSESLGGMVFCGADIGGYVENVEEDLLQRWYQAGAWYPFYRGHSGENTDRREPYLYSEDIQERIRRILRVRYAHIPYWYTLFFEHELTGDPIVRPLSYKYPQDESLFHIDNQWLVGNDIMVAPVLHKDVTSIVTKFPGESSEYWYKLDTMSVYPSASSNKIEVNMDSAPFYYRGGSIILRTDEEVRSTHHQKAGRYTMYVFLDNNSEASGNFYIDDFESFDYKNKIYQYYRFKYSNSWLSGEHIHVEADYSKEISIDYVRLYSVVPNAGSAVKKAKLTKIETRFTFGKTKSNFALNINNNK